MRIFHNLALKILQSLVYFFPVSFIFGNPIINTFIILIILLGVYYYKISLFNWCKKKIF